MREQQVNDASGRASHDPPVVGSSPIRPTSGFTRSAAATVLWSSIRTGVSVIVGGLRRADPETVSLVTAAPGMPRMNPMRGR
jgi:hypothetical protein